MIRQAISCDICAAEKRQTNHWFVAYEQGGELRVSGWTSRHRLKTDAKHLCGQTCLHKLIDEFMARSIAARAQRNGEAAEAQAEPVALTNANLAHTNSAHANLAHANPAHANLAHAHLTRTNVIDTSLTNAADLSEGESSARLLPSTPPAAPKPVQRPHPELVTMPARPYPKDLPPLPADTLRHASRRWHAEAWERERERELRAVENHPEIAERRRTSA